jgi:hypothetical protein
MKSANVSSSRFTHFKIKITFADFIVVDTINDYKIKNYKNSESSTFKFKAKNINVLGTFFWSEKDFED